MTAARIGATAAVVAGLLWLMLDSRLVTPEPAPPFTSLSLGGLALLFGAGAWAMVAGGQRERMPLPAGIALGVGGYALARVLAF